MITNRAHAAAKICRAACGWRGCCFMQVPMATTPSKWRSISDRLLKLKDGKSIVLECQGNPSEEARKTRNGLRSIRACFMIRRTVRVVDGKIVITRMGTWRTLNWIERDPQAAPFNLPRLPNLSNLDLFDLGLTPALGKGSRS